MKVVRYDFVRPPDQGALRSPSKTLHGFVRLEGFIGRVGVQEYENGDGTIRRELRPPEEVFSPDSMASFRQLPLTNMHPPSMLTPMNAARHAVGSIGDNVRQEGDWLAASMTCFDANALRCIEGGRAELSCGYTCELDDTPGEWQGEPYDCVQRNIVGNHLAICDQARAGEHARLRLDGAATAVVPCGEPVVAKIESPPPPAEVRHMKVRIDGVEYEMSEANAPAIQAAIDRQAAGLQAKADSATKAWEDAEGKLGVLAGKWDALKAESDARRDEAKKCDACDGSGKRDAGNGVQQACDACDGKGMVEDPEEEEMEDSVSAIKSGAKPARKDGASRRAKIRQQRAARRDAFVERQVQRRLSARVGLEVVARRFLKDSLDGVSDMDLRRKVIGVLAPSVKLDGKSDAYVIARFDSEVERAGEPPIAAEAPRGAVAPVSAPAEKQDARTAQQRYVDNQRNAWRGGKK